MIMSSIPIVLMKSCHLLTSVTVLYSIYIAAFFCKYQSYLSEALKNIITKETHVCITNTDHFISLMKPAM